MVSSSVLFPNRIAQLRYSLRTLAGHNNPAPVISCRPENSCDRRISHSPRCSAGNNAFYWKQQPRRPLSIRAIATESSQQQQQLNIKQRHDRHRHFSSATQSSSEDEEYDDDKNNNAPKLRKSKSIIDPNEVESKRRKVNDVSLLVFNQLRLCANYNACLES